jgi:hypothetical protein
MVSCNNCILFNGGTVLATYISEGYALVVYERIAVMPVTTTWNPTTHADYDALKGKDVFSADGEKVGSISQIMHPNMDMPAARGRHFFLLDPGLMKDWFGGFNQVYLPESTVSEVRPDRITLDLTAEQIKQRGSEWGMEPTGLASYRRA